MITALSFRLELGSGFDVISAWGAVGTIHAQYHSEFLVVIGFETFIHSTDIYAPPSYTWITLSLKTESFRPLDH